MRISGIAAAGLLAASVTLAQNRAPEAAAAGALLRADEEFSADAQRLGVAAAFVKWAAPDARMLPPGQDVVSGLDAVRTQMASFPAKATLSWKPFHADLAASGDLGYTLGTYELRSTDEAGKAKVSYGKYCSVWKKKVSYGKYCSVWKKQPDGSWRWVVDVGTSSPEPGKK